MNRKAVDNLFNKVAAVDKVLKCPVCLNRLSGTVQQCTQGHHVCTECRVKVSKCPLCESVFNGPRSYLIEDIVKKFDEIKILLTEATKEKEKFTCSMLNCNQELPYESLIDHIKKDHKDDLTEVNLVGKDVKFTTKWDITYVPKQFYFAQPILINRIWLFFLTVINDVYGRVYAFLEMTNSNSSDKIFKYQMNLGNPSHFISFGGLAVDSRRIPRIEDINRKNFKCIRMSLLRNNFKKFKYYECVLTIFSKKEKKAKPKAEQPVTEST